MQRVIGFVMILIGCGGLGIWYGEQYRQQVSTLQYFAHILELFEAEIRYGKCLLSECCLRLAEKVEAPYKNIFCEIYQKSMEDTGEGFGYICRQSMECGMKGVAAKSEDKELLINCFVKSGYEEDILQLRMIEQTKKQLEQRLEYVSKENMSKYRVALGMGVMSGLLLVILLI